MPKKHTLETLGFKGVLGVLNLMTRNSNAQKTRHFCRLIFLYVNYTTFGSKKQEKIRVILHILNTKVL